ncbi:MAG: DUF5680 domain-containing protein [Thermoplasmata archaeon]
MTLPESFQMFLMESKQHTYASGNGITDPIFPDSVQLEFSKGDLLYRDIYFGSSHFVGQETVFLKNTPIWSMAYSGGLIKSGTDKDQVYMFLREALMHPNAELPIRGPDRHQRGDLEYENLITGTMEMFHGFERILKNRVTIYLLHYSGGSIIP